MVASPRLEVVQVPAGEMKNFAYLVFCPATGRAVAVDPSFGVEALLREIRERELAVELLVNTHGHRDHCAGNGKLRAALPDLRLAGHPQDLPEADLPLAEGEEIVVGEGRLAVLHTPGHTPGSITLHPPGGILTGDTLFVTRVGRADLPGSDPRALYASLRRLADLPPETSVYPGHDYGPRPISTIGFERENNPFLRCPDLESFLQLRMG